MRTGLQCLPSGQSRLRGARTTESAFTRRLMKRMERKTVLGKWLRLSRNLEGVSALSMGLPKISGLSRMYDENSSVYGSIW